MKIGLKCPRGTNWDKFANGFSKRELIDVLRKVEAAEQSLREEWHERLDALLDTIRMYEELINQAEQRLAIRHNPNIKYKHFLAVEKDGEKNESMEKLRVQ